MVNMIVKYLLVFWLVNLCLVFKSKEFDFSSITQRASQQNNNTDLEQNLNNIFTSYKKLIGENPINIDQPRLLNRIKSDVNNLFKQKVKQQTIFSSFLQNGMNEENNEDDFTKYQSFVKTKFVTKGTPPSERKGHTTLIADTFMLIFGGCYQEIRCYNDIHFLDLRTRNWIQFPTSGQRPSPRGGHAAVLHGTKLWIFGGNTEQSYLNDVFSLNLETREWKQQYFKGDTPEARTNIAGVRDDNGRMIVFGGYTENGYDNSIIILDLIQKKFELPKVSGNIPSKRENYGIAYINNRVWLFGGFQEGGVLNDLYSIDIFTWTWIVVETQGPKPPPSESMSMTRVGKKIFISGGCDARKVNCFDELFIFDSDSLWWTKINNKKKRNTAREKYTSVFFRGNLYSFGGCHLHDSCYNDVHLMNVEEMCPNHCNKHGSCKKAIGCICETGFSDSDCMIKMKCKNDCSGKGVCNNNAKCACFPGFTGTTCDVNLHCPNNCTSLDNGICKLDGKCECKKGFSGDACDEVKTCEVIYVNPSFNLSLLNSTDLNKLNVTNISQIVNSTKGVLRIKRVEEDIKAKLNEFYQKLNISNIHKNNSLKFQNQTHKLHNNSHLIEMRNISLKNTSQLLNSRNATFHKHFKSIKNLSSKIKNSNHFNLSLNKTHGEYNFLEFQHSFLQRKMKNLDGCPNNCTNNGNCSQGKCFCKKGYGGSDCSLLNYRKQEEKDPVNTDEADSVSTKSNSTEKSKKKDELSFVTGYDKSLIWVISSNCTNNCFKRGICLNNTCFCEQGYTANDCSLTYKEFNKLGYKLEDFFYILIAIVIISIISTIMYLLCYKDSKDSYDYLNV